LIALARLFRVLTQASRTGHYIFLIFRNLQDFFHKTDHLILRLSARLAITYSGHRNKTATNTAGQ
jgi:hypothetical protein